MHLHGFNMYVLHEGPGTWDGTIISRNNPERRDVVMIRGNGHLVVQFDAANNPGQCHNSFAMTLLTNSQVYGRSTATSRGTFLPGS